MIRAEKRMLSMLCASKATGKLFVFNSVVFIPGGHSRGFLLAVPESVWTVETTRLAC